MALVLSLDDANKVLETIVETLLRFMEQRWVVLHLNQSINLIVTAFHQLPHFDSTGTRGQGVRSNLKLSNSASQSGPTPSQHTSTYQSAPY